MDKGVAADKAGGLDLSILLIRVLPCPTASPPHGVGVTVGVPVEGGGRKSVGPLGTEVMTTTVS